MGFCGFFLVHVVQVAMAGWNNFRAMVSGYEIQQAVSSKQEAAPMQAVEAASDVPTGVAGDHV